MILQLLYLSRLGYMNSDLSEADTKHIATSSTGLLDAGLFYADQQKKRY